jgi:hypothetical protein
LNKLFPVKDIGTPKRILSYVNDNFSEFEYLFTGKEDEDQFLTLMEQNKDYDPEALSLLKLYNEIMEKYHKIKNDSK